MVAIAVKDRFAVSFKQRCYLLRSVSVLWLHFGIPEQWNGQRW